MLFFFFNEPATTEIYKYLHTLSLHDALPIYAHPGHPRDRDRATGHGRRKGERAGRRDRLVAVEAGVEAARVDGGKLRTGVLRMGRVAEGALQREVGGLRSEEHTSELQSLMRTSYAVFCLKKKKTSENV